MKKFIFATTNDFEGKVELIIIEGDNILDAMSKYASTEEESITFNSLDEVYDFFCCEFQISDIKELKGELIDL